MTALSSPQPVVRFAFRNRRRGFALLITIVLVAFLVLILLGLTTLTRVETRVAENSQQLSGARQNALMALNIAIGQLQKNAGPDQRVTARADLGSGETTPNARWTAVYGSAVSANYAQRPADTALALIDTAVVDGTTGSSARLLSWLISGNEKGVFDPTADVATDGHITADAASLRAGLDFAPTTAISGLDASATVDTALTINDAANASHAATLLVGPGTVTSAVSGGQAIDYVAAPLVDITVPADNIPGLTGTTPTTIGRYAWWVGDEGVKARVNLPLVSAAADKPAAFANASRDAIELMDAVNPSVPAPALTASRIGTAYNPAGNVERVLALKQLPVAGAASLSSVVSRRYHDLTPYSTGLLADAYAGGLKRDLTALLDSSYAPSGSDPTVSTATMYPADASPGTYSEEIAGFTIPTWGQLRSHYQTVVPDAGADAGFLVPKLPVYNSSGLIEDTGVYPVLTYASLGMRFSTSGAQVNFNLYPVAVLWNPYTTPMRGGTYEIGMLFGLEGRCIQFQVEDPSLIDPSDIEAAWQPRETRDMAYGGVALSDPNSLKRDRDSGGIERYIRFQVTVEDMDAGESVVVTLPSNTTYQEGTLTPCPVALEPGLNILNHATMPGTVLPAGELGWNYRVVTSANYFKSVPGRYKYDGAKFAASSDQQLGGGGPGSSTGTNGGISAYLGKPRTTLPNTALQRQLWDPALNTWYQSIQSGYHEGNLVDNPLQGPELLADAVADEEPSLKTFVINVFSGEGTNGLANGGKNPKQRWLVSGNPRAPLQYQTRRDPSFATNYIGQVGTRAEMWPTWFATNFPGDLASAGLSHDWQNNQAVKASLFEVRQAGDDLVSLGQLQHANLSTSGTYPAYAVGNANAEFRIKNLAEVSTAVSRSISKPALGRVQPVYYDNSWLLNRALWDRYFFSTVPRTGSLPVSLPNRNLTVHDDTVDLTDPDEAAAGLLVAGSFNINSTSEQAWRAVLGGVNQLAYNPESRGIGTALGAALSRFATPTGGTTVPVSGGASEDLWSGYRELSPEQIAQLARSIVTEIRARGPFVSLADFVNRRLVDNPGTPEDERIKGALQAAIDATRVTGGGAYASNDTSGSLWNDLAVFTNPEGDGSYYNALAGRGTAQATGTTADAAYRRMAAQAPKFLSQADVLSTIGARLSARSDTFLIRTYGEVINPITGEPGPRAWCEAVVQRMADYVAAGDAASASPTITANRNFGRRFEVVSFRWLNAQDI